MYKAIIHGGTPLIGDIKVSGSNDSSVNIIFSSLFHTEPILLENVPESTFVIRCLELIEMLGCEITHVSKNRYIINPKSVNSFEVPYTEGKMLEYIFCLAGPLLFNFGKAIIPKPIAFTKARVQTFKEMWEEFGVEVFEDDRFLVLKSGDPKTAVVNIEAKDTVQTLTAILCAAYVNGETKIFNPSTKYEINDLIKFLNLDSTRITIDDVGTIIVKGDSVFKAVTFTIQPSINEVLFFSTSALLTKGNLTIKNLEREPLLAFLSTLSKIGCNFEFSKNDLKVWSSGDRMWDPLELVCSSTTGFLNSWHGYALLLLTQSNGDSSIVLNNSNFVFDYLTELKRMHVMTTTIDTNLDTDINIDQIKINVAGPEKLIGAKVQANDVYTAGFLLSATLAATGDSEIFGLDKINYRYDNIFERLQHLGADVEVIEE